MTNPHPKGSPEWQAWLNARIAEHDAKQRESGNPNQTFEIAPDRDENQR